MMCCLGSGVMEGGRDTMIPLHPPAMDPPYTRTIGHPVALCGSDPKLNKYPPLGNIIYANR